ncbi:MAG: DNA polymerase I [Armatimonadetes bacterium]|nr:DNA polymerase I [Armatimonadota bacterium]
MAQEPKRLVILDGYSLLYRAFFATRFLSTADGRPTNALLGFTNMLFNLMEAKPDSIMVAFDAPGKTFRHADYAEYKGTRKETAPELKAQFPVARDLCAALGIPSLEVTGYEADDVIGTISRQAEENGYLTTIVTGDLDSLQLVDDWVSVLTTRQGVSDTVTYNTAAVVERYGFGPEFVPDYKAIVGDTSDNIPGVPGIGAKGAAELITTFGGVESILARIDEVPEKLRKKIIGNEEQMRKSRWLATIDRHVPIQVPFGDFKLTPEQIESTRKIFEWLEFRSLARRTAQVLGRYVEGQTEEMAEAANAQVVLERLEVSLKPVSSTAEIGAFTEGKEYSLIFLTEAKPQKDLFDEPPLQQAFIARGRDVVVAPEAVGLEFLAANRAKAILHDSKPLYRKHKWFTDTPAFDTMIGGYVLQSGRSNYALTDLVQGYLEIQSPTDAASLAASVFLLKDVLNTRLERESQVPVMQEIEMPLIPLLAEMENYGIEVSAPALREFSKQLEQQIAITTTKVHELAGQEFNIGSPKQLGEILFEKLEIPGVGAKTKTGYATGVEILSQLAPNYEICAEVLNWRELSKLKSTYTDALERLIGPDGRIHTTYNQIGAATGRLSSNDPNLQNIPIRTELGRGIRKAFRAGAGYRLASLDYSQIELRVLAHMCRDEALVRAFETRQDVHTVTAQQMFGEGNVTKEQRRLAKMLNYAVLYGVTDFGLANQLGAGFSIAEAKALILQYNERFPRVKAFTEAIVQEARSKGFTTTLSGRRRYFPDIHNAKFNERKYAERQAMNAPIQGTAADMLKLAMVHAREVLQGAKTRMLLNVHDELVFELAAGEDEIIERLREKMENALPLNVPVEVDAKVGLNWDEMTEVGRPVPV